MRRSLLCVAVIAFSLASANVLGLEATSLTVPNVTGVIGEVAALSATLLRTQDGALLPGESVSFRVASVTVGSAVTDASGVATYSYTVASGPLTHTTLVASYAGSEIYAASSRSATFSRRANTALTVQNRGGAHGQTVHLSATLTLLHNGAPVSSRFVSFRINEVTVASGTTNSVGVATSPYTIPIALAPGTHPLTADFRTVGNYNGSTGSATFSVDRYATTLNLSNATGTAGQTVNLFAQLLRTIDSEYVAGAPIVYSVAGVTIGTTTTNVAGVAVRQFTMPVGALGPRTLEVSYAGSTVNRPSSDSGTLTQVGKTLGGQVDLQDWVGPVDGTTVFVQIFDSSSNLVEQFVAPLDANRRWTHANSMATTGPHTVKLKASHWLARDQVVTFANAGNSSMSHSLRNGDSDGDNQVGGGDLSIVSAAFLSAVGDPGYNPDADLDGDGEVGSSDLSILSANFLLSGD